MTPSTYAARAATFLTPEARTTDYFYPAIASEVLELLEAWRKGEHALCKKEVGDCLFFILVPRHEGFSWPAVDLSDHWHSSGEYNGRIASALIEVANAIIGNMAKTVREPHRRLEREEKMHAAIRDLVPVLRAVCFELGTTLAECAEINIEKLESRLARGVITGDGDHR